MSQLPSRLRSAALALLALAALNLALTATAAETAPAQTANAPADLAKADRYRAEKSYRLAREIYGQFLASPAAAGDPRLREIRFKAADCLWRENPQQNLQEAAKQLQDLTRQGPYDPWWAEANRSRGELLLSADRWGREEEIEENLLSAIQFWAHSTDVERGMPAYVELNFELGDYLADRWSWQAYEGVFTVVDEPPYLTRRQGPLPLPGKANYDNDLARRCFLNVLDRAPKPEDKARALLALAERAQRLQKKDEAQERVETVIRDFPQTPSYADALMLSAQLLSEKMDFVGALERLRTLTTKFRREQTPHFDQAQQMIADITEPRIDLGANQTFPPGSYIQVSVQYRNLNSVSYELWRIDPVAALQSAKGRSAQGFNDLANLNLAALGEKVRSWDDNEIENDNKHVPRSKPLFLDPLSPGFYVIAASASPAPSAKQGRGNPRAVFVVSDVSVAVKVGKTDLYAFVANALSGEPAPGAQIEVQHRWRQRQPRILPVGEDWVDKSEMLHGAAGKDGLAKVPLPKTTHQAEATDNHNYFTVATVGGAPAFAGGSYWFGQGPRQTRPVFYAYTDRPAYRPKETISFKAIARDYDGWTYSMPARSKWLVRIVNPQGGSIYDKTLETSEFGTLSGETTLGEEPALGMYQIQFLDPQSQEMIGGAPLCRVEEYKLPEFKVAISTTESAYRLGDTMNVDIQSDYYFGGPVAQADVTVVVHERPYSHWHWWPRPYPWFYDDYAGGVAPWRRGGEKTVKEEKLKTDAQGKATLSIPTPKDSKTDLAYTIEVRVVDQSRREIRANKELKVTRKEYFAYLRPEHFVYRPGDRAKIDIKTLNANDEPVARQAEMRLFQLQWSDKPFLLDGQEKKKGYQRLPLSTQPAATGKDGKTRFEWSPDRPGYYEIEWAGKDKYGETVTGQTRIWVCRPGDHDIGYRYGGIQIVADKETYQPGDTARLILSSFLPHAWALLSIEADDVYRCEVVELDGPVQLVEVPIGREHEPNVWANAAMNYGFQIFFDQKELIVPPVENYAQVRVTTDREQYRPGQPGKVTVETTDWKGQPVSMEVSIGVVDSAVYYIQNELAEDIQQFFYGQKRGLQVQTQTSHQVFSFAKLVKNDKGEIVPVNLYELEGLKDLSDEDRSERGRLGGGFLGTESRGDIAMASRERFSMARPMGMAMAEGRAMPAAPMAAAPMAAMKAGAAVGGAAEIGAAPLVEAVVRTDFRSTVFWRPSVVTGMDGKATVEITYPDSLTEWRATARAVDKETRVGWATRDTRTKKDVIVRLQAPRFFVEGDEVVISANVHNYTSGDQTAVVALGLQGLELLKPAEAAAEAKAVSTEPVLAAASKIEIGVAKDGERRVDWRCKVLQPGQATIRATAQTTVDSDAMEKTYPILEHGIEKFIAEAGALGGGAEAPGAESNATLALRLPEERKPEADSLIVQLSPSLAATMVGSLDYLAAYPYGCVEQTLSRFVPTVITARALRELGLTRPELEKKVPDMVKAGLDRLRDFQHDDGGWAWWKEGPSDPYMTAYVLYGLTLAREAGAGVPSPMLEGGIRCLNQLIIKFEREPDMLAWCLHALSYHKPLGETARKMLDVCWLARGELNPYSRALLLIAFHNLGDTEKTAILVENMENGVVEDKQTGTAHWGEAGICYRWSQGGIEATAFALKALLAADPGNPRIDQAMLWLVRNRRGAQWKSTRDTAVVVYAFADYIRVRKESKPEYDAEVFVNGQSAGSFHVDPDNVFDVNGKIDVPAKLLRSGDNEIRIAKKGAGKLYYSAYLTYYTREDPITAAGNEIFVEREYYRLTDKPTVQGPFQTEREKIASGTPIQSGDRIEVVLNVEAKNNYEYLVFEDLKAAGLEPVDIQSGYEWRDGLSIYREFRDEKTALFVSQMAQGKHQLRYTLRAEIPGLFSALPALAHAMYVPEIRANSGEFKFSVGETAPN